MKHEACSSLYSPRVIYRGIYHIKALISKGFGRSLLDLYLDLLCGLLFPFTSRRGILIKALRCLMPNNYHKKALISKGYRRPLLDLYLDPQKQHKPLLKVYIFFNSLCYIYILSTSIPWKPHSLPNKALISTGFGQPLLDLYLDLHCCETHLTP